MPTFPTLRTFIDWAGLVDAPNHAPWASSVMANATAAYGGLPQAIALSHCLLLDDIPGSTTAEDMMSATTWNVSGATFGGDPLDGRSEQTSAAFAGSGFITASVNAIDTGTVVMLIRPVALVGGFILGNATGPGRGMTLWLATNGTLILGIETVGDVCTSTISLVAGRTYHVAATYDGTTGRIYVDGADVSSASTPRTPVVGSSTVYIGFGAGWGNTAQFMVWRGGIVSGKDIAYLASLVRDPFAETNADVTAYVTEAMDVTRGRSTDQTADATGQATFTLLNHDDRFTPDRNWAANGSMETDLSLWSTEAGIHIGPGALNLRRVVDNAGLGGFYSGECDLGALPGAGLGYDIPQRITGGLSYTAKVALKTISGATALQIGLGSPTDAGDLATADVTVTGSWQVFTVAWTPDTYYDSFRFFIRGRAPAAATFRVDALTIGPGTAGFIEAPTKDQLTPGRAVLITAGYDPVTAGVFFGRLDKLSPDPVTKRAQVQAYDQFAAINRKTVPFFPTTGSHRETRAEVLRRAFAGQRNEERGRLPSYFYPAVAGDTSLAVRSLMDVPGGESITFSGEVRSIHAGSVGLSARLTIGAATSDRTLAFSGNWTKFQHTMAAPGTTDLVTYGFVASGFGRYEFRNMVLTTSPARLPFIPYGDGLLRSYRHNAAYQNPSMEAWARYWNTGFVNRCTNPSFEVDTAGWSVAALFGYHTASASITRTAGTAALGSFFGRVASAAANQGAHYLLSGTFVAGQAYCASVWVRAVTSAMGVNVAFGSSVTYGDQASQYQVCPTSGWTRYDLWWTPASTRTDAVVSFQTNDVNNFDVDALMVYWAPAPDAYQLSPADPLLLDASATESTFVLDETDGAVGTRCLRIASGNTVCYPFQQVGSWTTAPAGVQSFEPLCWYTASVYVKTGAVGSTITLSFGRQSNPAQAASTVYTTRTKGWERVAVRWRPQAGAATLVFTDVFVVIRSSAGAGTKIDALLVSEGRRLWPFEGRWAAALDPAESAWRVISQTLTGTVLSALNALNAANQTVHRIDPLPTFPWWQYVTRTRTILPNKLVAETFDDDLTGATGWDTSYDSIRNVARVDTGTQYIDTTANAVLTNPSSGTWTYSDPVSVQSYDRVDTATLGGALLENKPNNPALQESLAQDVIARYGQPRSRPTIFTENRWPSQLLRGPDDLVRVTFPRAGKYGALYLITTMALHIEQNGRLWRAGYTLEEHAFTPDETGVLAGGMPEYTGPEATLAVGMPQ